MKPPGAQALARLTPESRGILGMLVGSLFFVCMESSAKAMAEEGLPSIQAVWARYAGQTALLLIIFAPRLRLVMKTVRPGLQALRSILFFAVTTLYFTALGYLEFAEASALLMTAPLMITALAAMVLGETVGPRRWLGVAVGLVGAVILLDPGAAVFQPAALLALGAALGLAGYQISTRFLGTRDSIWTTLLYTTGFGTVASSIALPFVWVAPDAGGAALMAASGIAGFLGQLCLVWALAQAPASVLAPFNYAGLVWAILFGILIFGETPDVRTLAGAAVIVGAGLYVWHRERMLSHVPSRPA